MQKSVYLLIGPHRSGTSLVAQILSAFGLDVGRTLMLPATDNPRGFWENQKIIDIHDELLQSFQKDWSTASQLPEDWLSAAAAKTAKEKLFGVLSTDFLTASPILVKDPRLVFLKPLWDELANEKKFDLKAIGILRSPIEVTHSIHHRNGGPYESALFVALSYFAGLIKLNNDMKMPIIQYEALLESDTKAIIKTLSKLLAPVEISSEQYLTTILERSLFTPELRGDPNEPITVLYNQTTTPNSIFIDYETASRLIESEAFLTPYNYLDETFRAKNSLFEAQMETVELEKSELFELHQKITDLEVKALSNADLLDVRKAEIVAWQNEADKKDVETTRLEQKISDAQAILKERDKQHSKDLAEFVSKLEVKLEEKQRALDKYTKLNTDNREIIGALSTEIKSYRNKVKSLENSKNDYLKKLNGLKAEYKELETSSKAEINTQIQENKALKKRLSVEKRRVTMASKQTLALGESLKSLELQNNSLISNIENQKKSTARVQAEKSKVERSLQEKNSTINQLNERMFSLNENLENSLSEYEKLQRLKDMQDLTIEVDSTRSKSVEKSLNTQIDELRRKVAYYENSPLKAALKSSTFGTLRLAKRALPLPGTTKERFAKKFDGVARRLKAPDTDVLGGSSQLDLPPPDKMNIEFAFKDEDNPVISIIVPVYNEISQTIACLHSIYQQNVSVPYEVILADDRSPDPFHVVFEKIQGLKYYRNPENLGFLQNCNLNSGYARGDYIIFLNNDTLVKPGWMQTLYDTFNEHGDVGIVGSKLVFPTGELQEAGGIIWEDASGWNWGRGQNPDHPLYNFVRDVDYVSGASFMIKTDLFRDVGGFYSGLEKAYYEDTDCCFRVRELGYRVLYQPLSEVIHIEGLSSGTDLTSGAKKYQTINKEIFYETWRHRLETHLPNAQTPEIASDRKVRGHILYVDTVTPEKDKDAGSVNAFYCMRILIEMGYRVHFIPGTNFAYWGDATSELQKMGVECVYHPFYSNMDMFLNERGDVFDYVFLSRAEINDMYLNLVRQKCPSAKIINNTVDLHYLRIEREAELSNDDDLRIAADNMKNKEISIMEASDATILLSSHEFELLSRNKKLENKLWNIPLIQPLSEPKATFSNSRDIVFIGGYKHPPNVDAVDWLVNDIWPEMRKVLPGVRLLICGSSIPDRFLDYAGTDVIIQGFVPDLGELLSKTRLTIAPLRFGAGQKGKVTSSFGAGIPCLGTHIAFEGMEEEGLDNIKLHAETPQEFAKLAKKIYFNETLWNIISSEGVEYYNTNFAYKSLSKNFVEMFDSLDAVAEK